MGMKISPIGDRVLVKQDDELEKSAGGIYLPDSAKDAPQRGTVMGVGKGKRDEKGQMNPLSVKEGDKIFFGKYSGTKVNVGTEELLFMREDDILAVIED